MQTQNPEPQPPLYLAPPRCQTCGKCISHICIIFQEKIKSLTGADISNIPLRTVNLQKTLSSNPKTEEAKILDSLGVLK